MTHLLVREIVVELDSCFRYVQEVEVQIINRNRAELFLQELHAPFRDTTYLPPIPTTNLQICLAHGIGWSPLIQDVYF
jgi:hypothetical protein